MLSEIARFAGSRADLLRSLEKNADGLQEIAEDFRRIAGHYKIKSFYETDRMHNILVRSSTAT
jgi:hypothetical protein